MKNVSIYYNGSIITKEEFENLNIKEIRGTLYFLYGTNTFPSTGDFVGIHQMRLYNVLSMVLVEKNDTIIFILYSYDTNQGAGGGGPSPPALTSNVSISFMH